tara:strand:- start:487 stop:708 length:222 start_codon:yes stop_codon:yes gene_type:complete
MKTVAMRKAAKAKANGNGKEKKPRKTSRVSTPNKPNIKDFTSISKDSKGNLTKNTNWKAYERAQTNYRVRTKN